LFVKSFSDGFPLSAKLVHEGEKGLLFSLCPLSRVILGVEPAPAKVMDALH